MKTKVKLILGITVWSLIAAIVITAIAASCSNEKPIALRPSDEGLLLNDKLVAIKENDGNITIKNTETGEVTAEKIKFDWTSSSPNDSLGVFCSDGKRGYYNSYTGKIVVPAQYRRAWIFSEGLAGVQKNGHIVSTFDTLSFLWGMKLHDESKHSFRLRTINPRRFVASIRPVADKIWQGEL